MSVENIENKRKRLIYRSWHRGTREMDLLLGSFADNYINDFTEEELDLYDSLLLQSDPDLYNWITRQEKPPANILSNVFEKLLAHSFV